MFASSDTCLSSSNDSLVLSRGGAGGRGAASTGEPSLCFIASHCQAGRLQPSSLFLMGVSVLFLQFDLCVGGAL